MLKLNLLTGKKGERAEEPMIVSEEGFWEHYLRLTDLRPTGHYLNEKEIQVMTLILAGDPNKSYFRGTEAKEIKTKLRIKASDLSKMKTALVFKGFIEETGEVRGDALPTRGIRDFQKYVKNALNKGTLPPINFTVPLFIEQEEVKH